MKVNLTNNFIYYSNKKADNIINPNHLSHKKNLYYTDSTYLCGNYYMAFSGIKNGYKNTTRKEDLDHFAGCILGGAIGDAFGAPIEFMKLKKIKNLYGEQGLHELVADAKRGEISFTDDTQLTMFTADGILKSQNSQKARKAFPNYNLIYGSYRNWYKTCALSQRVNRGWITKLDNLLGYGGSGKTCMKVLSQDESGSIELPLNNSRGSGGVMRVSPIGLYYCANPKNAFNIAEKSAALTHGHPDAYLSAGVYAAIIANIISGQTIKDAICSSLDILKTKKNHEALYNKIIYAMELSQRNDISAQEAISKIGKGWDGDEALAMAIYSAMKNQDNYQQAIIDAVNHDGDSDTVAAITGGIVGAYVGLENIPENLRGKIKLEKELIELSNDLLISPKNIKNFKRKYKK